MSSVMVLTHPQPNPRRLAGARTDLKATAMTTTTKRLAKGEQRRAELIERALVCLAEKGYAATSMRDIATAADLNLGRLHYYFQSKADLLLVAIMHYKTGFISDIEGIVANAKTPEALRRAYVEAMVSASTRDAFIHRLWYDVRSRSLFEPPLQSVVDGIEKGLRRSLSGVLAALGAPTDKETVDHFYHLIDGYFLAALGKTIRGQQSAAADFRKQLNALLPGTAEAVRGDLHWIRPPG